MDRDPVPPPLSGPDRAFLLAARAWPSPDKVFERFGPRCRAAPRNARNASPPVGASEALARLRSEHEAQARPDLKRVHPSWWVRVLKDEPRSVQNAVITGLPPEAAGEVRAGLGLPAEGTEADRPPDPVAERTARSLWAVRLSGDSPSRDDDPPVIVAISRLDERALAHLFHAVGLAKWALAARQPLAVGEPDRARMARLRDRLGGADPRYLAVVEHDTGSIEAGDPLAVAKAGMTTLARLLAAAEPYRAKWALQHLPYPTARTLRALIGPERRRAPSLARWESGTLAAAWTLLREEGRADLGLGLDPERERQRPAP